MKKKAIYALIFVLILLTGLYAYTKYTFDGRVLGLYAFGGFKAPISLKIDCAKITNEKVEEKFKLPLKFTEETKNALREYWHFSYYRECLFNNGYDFGGNPIKPSDIVNNIYTNYFGGIYFEVPTNTIIVDDNLTDPDIEDRRLTSTLKTNEALITVLVYRSYDDAQTLEELEEKFTGFSTSTGEIIEKSIETTRAGTAILSAYQNDGLFGFISMAPDKKAIAIFGENLSKETLDTIESSFKFLNEI